MPQHSLLKDDPVLHRFRLDFTDETLELSNSTLVKVLLANLDEPFYTYLAYRFVGVENDLLGEWVEAVTHAFLYGDRKMILEAHQNVVARAKAHRRRFDTIG